jgi:hypothetical protein
LYSVYRIVGIEWFVVADAGPSSLNPL